MNIGALSAPPPSLPSSLGVGGGGAQEGSTSQGTTRAFLSCEGDEGCDRGFTLRRCHSQISLVSRALYFGLSGERRNLILGGKVRWIFFQSYSSIRWNCLNFGVGGEIRIGSKFSRVKGHRWNRLRLLHKLDFYHYFYEWKVISNKRWRDTVCNVSPLPLYKLLHNSPPFMGRHSIFFF